MAVLVSSRLSPIGHTSPQFVVNVDIPAQSAPQDAQIHFLMALFPCFWSPQPNMPVNLKNNSRGTPKRLLNKRSGQVASLVDIFTSSNTFLSAYVPCPLRYHSMFLLQFHLVRFGESVLTPRMIRSAHVHSPEWALQSGCSALFWFFRLLDTWPYEKSETKEMAATPATHDNTTCDRIGCNICTVLYIVFFETKTELLFGMLFVNFIFYIYCLSVSFSDVISCHDNASCIRDILLITWNCLRRWSAGL